MGNTRSTYASQLSSSQVLLVLSMLTCRSDPKAEFVVVHNGIITNYRELKAVLQNKGYMFETETDTECIAKLAKYIFDQQKGNIDFSQLAKLVVRELEGAYALLFKSVHYPNEVVATRKGSPLLVGVKTEKKLKVDFVDVEFGALEHAEPAGSLLHKFAHFQLLQFPSPTVQERLVSLVSPWIRREMPISTALNPGLSCPKTVSPSQ
jgi:glutamine phosphoribosylpyrophosphate amidotransferase